MPKTLTTAKTFNSVKCPEIQPATHLARRLLSLKPRGSEQVSSEGREHNPGRHLLVGIMLMSMALLSGCFNQMKPRTSKYSSSSSSLTFNNSGTTQNTKLIYKVVRTQMNEKRSLDLIGPAAFSKPAATDGYDFSADALGGFCQSTSQDSNGCLCKIRYEMTPTSCSAPTISTTSSGTSTSSSTPCSPSTRKFPVEKQFYASYVEANLVRCPLPEDYESGEIQISLIRQAGNLQTNTFTFNPIPFTNYDDPLFYTPVQRYVCRWSPFVSHMMDGNMIDTLQSDSQQSTLRLMFYTTNWGRALAEFSMTDSSYFECPPHVSGAKASLTVKMSSGTGSAVDISDASGNAVRQNGQDRVNFMLAKSPVGPFDTELKFSQAPNINAGTLGFAARPDPSSRTCTARAPAGFEWKKLWLFRGAARNRTYLATNAYKQFHMACSLGGFRSTASTADVTIDGKNYAFKASNYHVFSDCGKHVSNVSTDLKSYFNGLLCDGDTSPNAGIPGSNPLSRILVPASQGSTNYFKCVSINAEGTNWQDACSTSQLSCGNVAKNTVPDPFSLCGSSSGLNIQKSGTQVQVLPIDAPAQYLFYVGENDDRGLSAMTSTQLSLPATSGQGETFSVIDSINGATFPLCVLQKSGSAGS
ncbi:hypothetical protein EBZ37_01655 [bacterium]|nr:hypothetical protein [bacterium]